MSGRTVSIIDKVLKRSKPAGRPVEQTTTFEFVPFLKTAKVLGITGPPVAAIYRAAALMGDRTYFSSSCDAYGS